MSKTILIVEGDAAQSRTLASALEQAGFQVEETLDGKGSLELIRRQQPALVVMAVDLSAGQNGYILCGKLKKDDDLRNVPLIIVGNPDGFAQHRKLKTHADDYVAKPVDTAAFVAAVGNLVGYPEQQSESAFEGSALGEVGVEAEEISVDADRLDEAFSDLTADVDVDDDGLSVEIPLETTSESAMGSELSALDAYADPGDGGGLEPLDELDEKTQSGVEALTSPLPSQGTYTSPPPPADPNELRTLRTQVAELQATLDDSLSRLTHLQGQVQEMESELEQKSTELVAARASGGGSARDTIALKEAANRKDKEILRLKGELNEKDQEIVNLREREVQLEQAAAEAEDEKVRVDAQLQTMTQRSDALSQDRRRLEQQVQQAASESRGAVARAGALETELGAAQQQVSSLHLEVEGLRERVQQLEQERDSAQAEVSSLRLQVEAERAQTAHARQESEELGNQLAEQANTFASEAAALRAQLTEAQEAATRNEERATRLYSRIRADEKLREKTKKALAVAQQLMEEQPSEDVDLDEAAA